MLEVKWIKLFSFYWLIGLTSSYKAIFHTANKIWKHKTNLHLNMITTEQSFWITPEGLNLEVLYSPGNIIPDIEQQNQTWYSKPYSQILGLLGTTSKTPLLKKPPLLFIHGSYHSSWCWEENYFEYFNTLGYDCYALSLRGTSNTGMPSGDRSASIKVEDHVSDVIHAINTILENDATLPPPIIISHSFGGVITMKLLELPEARKNVTAAAFLCSVPPSGNGEMTKRFMQTRCIDTLKIVWGFVFKAATFDPNICRELFFDKDMPAEDVNRYMKKFQIDSRVGIDLQSLASVLPILQADPITKRAKWIPSSSSSSSLSVNIEVANRTTTTTTALTNIQRRQIPFFVLGTYKDFIVDKEGVEETATFLGVNPLMLNDTPHDVMLGSKWRSAADAIGTWLLEIEREKEKFRNLEKAVVDSSSVNSTGGVGVGVGVGGGSTIGGSLLNLLGKVVGMGKKSDQEEEEGGGGGEGNDDDTTVTVIPKEKKKKQKDEEETSNNSTSSSSILDAVRWLYPSWLWNNNQQNNNDNGDNNMRDPELPAESQDELKEEIGEKKGLPVPKVSGASMSIIPSS